MVMADYGDRNQRNRRRYHQKLNEQDQDRELSLSPPAQAVPLQPIMTRVPKILLKPGSIVNNSGVNENAPPSSAESHNANVDEKTVEPSPAILLKGRGNAEVVRSIANNHVNIPGLLASDGLMQSHLHHVQSSVQPPTNSFVGYHPSTRLSSGVIKLIDDSFCFSEAGLELLLDQTDFSVIGVLGLQGVGKSTILSMLAGSNVADSSKAGVFERSRAKHDTAHTTAGIDMYVTPERTIILDSQPVLSSSTLDALIHQEKKAVINSTLEQSICLDNHIELQSLQIATFMMTVCNVVIIVMDWFADATLFKFLHLAEMMKPSTPGSAVPSPQNGIVTPSDEVSEYYPHIMFVLNKATPADFRPEKLHSMQKTIRQLMCQSKLKYTGMPLTTSVPRGIKLRADRAVNLFVLPLLKDTEQNRGKKTSTGEEWLLDYHGHAEFSEQARDLTRKLLSVPRRQLTNTVLMEKNWFQYAARVWEVIRKSQLLTEYSRLQS